MGTKLREKNKVKIFQRKAFLSIGMRAFRIWILEIEVRLNNLQLSLEKLSSY